MRQFFTTFLIVIFFFQSSSAQCELEAPFLDGPEYPLSGTATLTLLLDGTKTLTFDSNFSTTAGPDLHVYLSKSAIVSTPNGVLQTPNTLEIALLKSASGSQSYDLTSYSSLELDSYDYVIIHCKQYDHYWGTGTFGVQSGIDCSSLSIPKKSAESVEVFPTLIRNHKMFVRLSKKQRVTVDFYSVIGESLGETLTLSEQFSIIDTSFLSKGMYLVQLKFVDQTYTQKIIIQ